MVDALDMLRSPPVCRAMRNLTQAAGRAAAVVEDRAEAARRIVYEATERLRVADGGGPGGGGGGGSHSWLTDAVPDNHTRGRSPACKPSSAASFDR